MKKSKKGVTLVELIICCGIIVMLGGACTAVLLSGQRIFNTSSGSAGAQLDTDVVQAYLTNVVPRATNIGQPSDVSAITAGTCLYFAGGGSDVFTIRIDGKETSIRSVSDFKYQIVPAGTADSARSQFLYELTMDDGSTYSSGFIMGNLAYTKIIDVDHNPVDFVSFSGEISAKTYPVCFSVPVAGS